MSKNKKNSLPMGLIVGIILAFIVFLIVFTTISNSQPITVEYYVPKKELAPEQKVTIDDFKIVSMPENAKFDDKSVIPANKDVSFTDPQSGQTTTKPAKEFLNNATVYFPMMEGEVEIQNKFKETVPSKYKSMSSEMSADRRYVSIELNTLKSFGGSLKQGDRVDLTYSGISTKDLGITTGGNATGGTDAKLSITALQALKVTSLLYDGASTTDKSVNIAPKGAVLEMTPTQVEIFKLLGADYQLSLNSTNPVRYDTNGITLGELLQTKTVESFFVNDKSKTDSTTQTTTTTTGQK